MADLDRVHAWLKDLIDGFLREECWFGTVALVGNQNLTPMPDLLEAFVAWAQADPNVPDCERAARIGNGLYQRFTGQVLSLARAMLEMRATRGGYRYIDRLGGSVLCVNIVVRDKGAGFRGEDSDNPRSSYQLRHPAQLSSKNVTVQIKPRSTLPGEAESTADTAVARGDGVETGGGTPPPPEKANVVSGLAYKLEQVDVDPLSDVVVEHWLPVGIDMPEPRKLNVPVDMFDRDRFVPGNVTLLPHELARRVSEAATFKNSETARVLLERKRYVKQRIDGPMTNQGVRITDKVLRQIIAEAERMYPLPEERSTAGTAVAREGSESDVAAARGC